MGLLALSSVLSLGACGNKNLDTFEKIAESMCACENSACTEQVEARFEKEITSEIFSELKNDEPDKSKAAMRKMTDCMGKMATTEAQQSMERRRREHSEAQQDAP